ncbi:MAG TPA: GreA/GreB family elongation factor [bacterium]|nr:GreA/GreB family elongation factor [bacterium]
MNTIYITKNDHKKLTDFVYSKNQLNDYDRALAAELTRAKILSSKTIPEDIVSMNSLVSFTDVQTGDDFSFWLVFPADADFEKNKISVVSPIGCALLGSKIGDLVIIETPAGQKKVKIKKILRQSETVGK